MGKENLTNKEESLIENKQKNTKIFYGDSNKVNSINHKDYNDYIKNTESNQELNGFNDQYLDFIDYIIKITHRIWEEKGIGVIYDTYHNNILIHSGSQNIHGIGEVISGTLQTLHAFPDRKLIAQDVIWSKHDKDGYFSSHRVMSTGTNINMSNFGPPTEKKINFRTVADCAVYKNRIYEEWLVRDNLWIVKQLGLNPHKVAKKMLQNNNGEGSDFQSEFGLGEAFEGQLYPEKYKAGDSSIGEFVREVLNNVYSCRLFNMVKNYYNDNAVVHYICNQDLVGYNEIQGMLISLFASFPNADFNIDRITCNQRSQDNDWDVAVRWRLRGLHEGIGYFAKPSGKPVEILAISHFHIVDKKIEEEWITFDGLDVLKQIYAQSDEDYEMKDGENDKTDANNELVDEEIQTEIE